MDFGSHARRALDQLRRAAADPSTYVADGFGRLVRDTPPERLGQLMRSPARRAVLDGIFWQMPKQLNAEQAAGVHTTIRWCITGRPDDGVDSYHLIVEDGRARTTRDPVSGEPRLTITVDGAELVRLVSGNSDPMAAYFKGRISLRGDLMAAAKLASMFRMPSPPPKTDGNGDRAGEHD